MNTPQPVWRRVFQTDRAQFSVDETGLYPPTLEVADDLGDGTYALYVVQCPRLCLVPHPPGRPLLVPEAYDPSWPHPVEAYDEWFAEDLGKVARCVGTTVAALRDQLTSDDPGERAAAYEAIASYHSWDNFDSYPLRLTDEELDARWR